MRNRLLPLSFGLALLTATGAHAQSVTATCKDGSSFSGTTRSGACRGHGGVGTWGATSAAATTGAATTPGAQAAATPAKTPPAKTPPATTPDAPPASKTAARPAGGSGQVWVNSSSKVYHCEGDRYYGKTKSGTFMSETAAKAAGDRPSGGKTCS